MRSCKPDPLAADIVQVREDRGDSTDSSTDPFFAGVFSGRFGCRFSRPGSRVKMFDKNLVDAIIGGKDLDCGSAEVRVNLGLTRGHCSLLLDLWYFWAVGPHLR